MAKALAQHAFERAQALVSESKPVFGLGLTATIATDRKKRGDHRCAIAVTDTFGTVSYDLTMKKGARTRHEEEHLVSRLCLYAICEACGVFDVPDLPLVEGESVKERFEPVPLLHELHKGSIDWLCIKPNGDVSAEPLAHAAFLSGSFNPLHVGHKTLAHVASEQLEQTVYFELPLINADKDPIDLTEARRRAVQFLGLAPLVLSRAPLFSDKANLFPDSVFVLGADTAARLVAPRFYEGAKGLEAAFRHLEAQGTRFLVAGRSSKGDFKTLDDIAIPSHFSTMFTAIPEDAFKMDISSTQLRNYYANN